MAPATPLAPASYGQGPRIPEAVAVLLAWLLLERAAVALWPALALQGRYWLVAAVRVVESLGVVCYWKVRGWPWDSLGLAGPRARHGLTVGAVWALALFVLVVLAEIGGRWIAGFSLLRLVTGRPSPLGGLAALLVAGGLCGPIFEELLFRGILYTGLRRRLPALPAAVAGALVFATAHHAFSGLDPVRAAGGLLFCAAYERSGSLWASLVLHVSGNLAIFLTPWVLP